MESPVTGEELRLLAEPLHACVSGRVYRVRKLTAREVLSLGNGIPDLAGLSTAVRETPTEELVGKIGPQRADALLARVERIVELGLVDPRIGDGEGAIPLRLVPAEDQAELVRVIMELSGFTREASERLRP